MKTYQDFVKEEKILYRTIDSVSKDVRISGISKAPKISDNYCGYYIVLIHPQKITDDVARFSEKVARAVPASIFDETNIHTNLLHYGENNLPCDYKILSIMMNSLYDSRAELCQPLIDYKKGWTYDRTTVLAKGVPDEAFLNNAMIILKNYPGKEVVGIDLWPPWGAHITSNRFRESRKPEDLHGFFSVMDKAPDLGVSRPVKINVGYFALTPEKLLYDCYGSVKLAD